MDVRLAVTGFGNVGRGVASLLAERGPGFERRYGIRLVLTGVADRGGAAVASEGMDPQALLETKARSGTVAGSPWGSQGLAGTAFLDQAGADMLLEAASTSYRSVEPAWTYATGAFERGMDLILASKGILALQYGQLMDEARRHGRQVRFSATIGAPLPSLDVAEHSLVGADILGFEAILNGTTNQILTAMDAGASYEEGVRQAQAIGIAETDPTLDVDGWDAAAKTVIVSNAVLDANLQLSDVHRIGIRGVTREDLHGAREAGQTIKLICRATRDGSYLRAAVGPERRPLAGALGRLRGDQMGLVFHTQPYGAVSVAHEGGEHGGGITTAMTMLRDVLNLVRERAT
jgi:homoserine dehydrogenase